MPCDDAPVIAHADDRESTGNNYCCLASRCGRASGGDEGSITDRSGVRFAPAGRHARPPRAPAFDSNT